MRFPRGGARLTVLEVLLSAHQRLFGEIVAAFLHGQHGALLPVVGELELGVRLILEALLVGDRGGHLLLGLGQLVAHVDDDLIQHLLGILGRGDEVVEIRLDERRKTIEDTHGSASLAEGGQLTQMRGERESQAFVRREELLEIQVREFERSVSTTASPSMP